MRILKSIENAKARAEKKGRKWGSTIRQDVVRRAIERGEFEALECKYSYTDDYLWDNAVNFGRRFVTAERMLREYSILTPSCWINGEKKNINGKECYEVTINFHSNLSYAMYVPVA